MRSTTLRRLVTGAAGLAAVLTLTVPAAAAAQPPVPGELYKVQLLTLRCTNISESGEDEVYIKLDGGVAIPTSVCRERGTVDYSGVDPERFIFEGGTILSLELWEQDPDIIDPDDKLGVFELNDSRVGTTNLAKIVNGTDYAYSLTYRVLPLD
ncbi:hypothetical protein [Streptomyces sp. A012304]|uniref:hypothetical protein n=1 Tax=Streptomyces sp. A012304 TaxID=375446 RepID=UPI00222E916D|nr:hypothetical protein [Streptomyces sp. A012304]GKQ40647.1 hypothetical protein ALMP_71700 [Streptomyces sp. A012304]